MEYIINLTWDDEATLWVATSDNMPGLLLESGSFDALQEHVRFAAPELISLNGTPSPESLTFLSKRKEMIAM